MLMIALPALSALIDHVTVATSDLVTIVMIAPRAALVQSVHATIAILGPLALPAAIAQTGHPVQSALRAISARSMTVLSAAPRVILMSEAQNVRSTVTAPSVHVMTAMRDLSATIVMIVRVMTAMLVLIVHVQIVLIVRVTIAMHDLSATIVMIVRAMTAMLVRSARAQIAQIARIVRVMTAMLVRSVHALTAQIVRVTIAMRDLSATTVMIAHVMTAISVQSNASPPRMMLCLSVCRHRQPWQLMSRV
jgi:hypothetical protein